MKLYRQGDILLVREEDEPWDHWQGKPTPGFLVVAQGEKTGHDHVITGPGVAFSEDWRSQQPDYVHLPTPARMIHPEHAPLDLESGYYRIVRQREYQYSDGERQVED
jgi:hypothetical protein